MSDAANNPDPDHYATVSQIIQAPRKNGDRIDVGELLSAMSQAQIDEKKAERDERKAKRVEADKAAKDRRRFWLKAIAVAVPLVLGSGGLGSWKLATAAEAVDPNIEKLDWLNERADTQAITISESTEYLSDQIQAISPEAAKVEVPDSVKDAKTEAERIREKRDHDETRKADPFQ